MKKGNIHDGFLTQLLNLQFRDFRFEALNFFSQSAQLTISACGEDKGNRGQ
jgi:hypothetical protein